nr:hypothetical protein [Massilia sp. Se16.2.3]
MPISAVAPSAEEKADRAASTRQTAANGMLRSTGQRHAAQASAATAAATETPRHRVKVEPASWKELAGSTAPPTTTARLDRTASEHSRDTAAPDNTASLMAAVPIRWRWRLQWLPAQPSSQDADAPYRAGQKFGQPPCSEGASAATSSAPIATPHSVRSQLRGVAQASTQATASSTGVMSLRDSRSGRPAPSNTMPAISSGKQSCSTNSGSVFTRKISTAATSTTAPPIARPAFELPLATTATMNATSGMAANQAPIPLITSTGQGRCVSACVPAAKMPRSTPSRTRWSMRLLMPGPPYRAALPAAGSARP